LAIYKGNDIRHNLKKIKDAFEKTDITKNTIARNPQFYINSGVFSTEVTSIQFMTKKGKIKRHFL
jgi:hypothetical protein